MGFFIRGVIALAIFFVISFPPALGLSIIFDVDLIYGFIIPLALAAIGGLVPVLRVVINPLIAIMFIVALIAGLINLF